MFPYNVKNNRSNNITCHFHCNRYTRFEWNKNICADAEQVDWNSIAMEDGEYKISDPWMQGLAKN